MSTDNGSPAPVGRCLGTTGALAPPSPRLRRASLSAGRRAALGRIRTGGGFVFCQVHNIQPDVPPENILAMYEAVQRL